MLLKHFEMVKWTRPFQHHCHLFEIRMNLDYGHLLLYFGGCKHIFCILPGCQKEIVAVILKAYF